MFFEQIAAIRKILNGPEVVERLVQLFANGVVFYQRVIGWQCPCGASVPYRIRRLVDIFYTNPIAGRG
jgi:hypothetical protein